MVTLPEQYIVEKFCQHAGYPKFNRRTQTWYGGCPICREGKSWGKKRRLYYKLDKNYIFCFNCGWKGSPTTFIKEVTGVPFKDIMSEANTYDNIPKVYETPVENNNKRIETVPKLPLDSINLFDQSQTDYWLNSEDKKAKQVVNDALELIKTRGLDKAVNRSKSLWVSLTDPCHKNRLIVPFYDRNNEIIFYQSRTIYKDIDDLPKYISKPSGIRSLFNVNQVDPSLNDIFIFEGPIDSCFVKNGVGLAGINANSTNNFTEIQQQQLNQFKLLNKVWVLDSQWLDRTSYEKSLNLLTNDSQVFIWPENIGKRFKDVNDVCVYCKSTGLTSDYILQHTYHGIKGVVKLKQINPR